MTESKTPAPKSARRHLKLILIRLLQIGLLAGLLFVLYLDVTLVARFSGQKWRLPTHVYARPLEIYVGADIDRSDLIWELQTLGYREKAQMYDSGQFRRLNRAVEVHTRGFEFWDGEEAARTLRIEFSGGHISGLSVVDEGRLPIARLEPMRIGGIYPDSLEDRRVESLDNIPDLVSDTLLAVEDQGFYQHWGLSLRGIARAIKADVQAGGFVQGGSTITQQLIKNFYLNSERTLRRKLLELLMAPLLELHFSKEEILETYLNEVYFGQSGRRSIQGIGLASHYYFGQPLRELGPHQVALLIGIIKGPSAYDPWRHPQNSKKRRDLVLSIMQQQGLISEPQKQQYQANSLDVWQRPARSLNPYPAYMSMVRRQLTEVYDQEQLNQGLRIFTHLDPMVQRKLEKVAAGELSDIERQRGLPNNTLETGAVVTRLSGAEVVAMIGGRESGVDGFNRALDARRAIGSLIKPVIYLSALERRGNSLASMISDAPLSVETPDNQVWEPRNYDRKSHGDLILLDALINSYNQSTARLGLQLGVDNVIKTVRRLGVDTQWSPYPATLLGSGSLSPMDVSRVYQTLANDGFHSQPSVINSVYSTDHQPLERYSNETVQVIYPTHSHLIQFALQMVMLEGSGKSAFNWLNDDLRVAGKTGTTNGQRDSWFAGFGGEYLAVFWVGRDDNKSTPLTGASGALRLWAKLMADIEKQPIDFIRPEQIEYHWINRLEGSRSASDCENAILIPFVKGTVPRKRDTCSDRVIPRVLDWFKDALGL